MKTTTLTFLFSVVALSFVGAAVPLITSVNNASFIAGVPCKFTFTAINLPLTPGTWQATGVLPSSLSFDSVAGTLSGTPVPGDEGAYVISVTVDNASGTSLPQNFTLNVGDVIAIIKYNTASTWTRYEADDLQTARSYTHKPVSGSDAWSRYDVVNLTLGTARSIYYYTKYDRGVALKRYTLGSEFMSYGGASLFLFSRAGGTTAAPTYRSIDEFASSFSDGGPDGSTPSTSLYRFESLYYVTTAPLGMTTVIAATTVPLIPAIKFLLPTGATGIDNDYTYRAGYASIVPGTLPDTIGTEFSTGAATVNYDSVLSASVNKATPTAASLVDYDGTVLRPRSSSYAVKLVRDALELAGYEEENF